MKIIVLDFKGRSWWVFEDWVVLWLCDSTIFFWPVALRIYMLNNQRQLLHRVILLEEEALLICWYLWFNILDFSLFVKHWVPGFYHILPIWLFKGNRWRLFSLICFFFLFQIVNHFPKRLLILVSFNFFYCLFVFYHVKKSALLVHIVCQWFMCQGSHSLILRQRLG